MIKAATKIVILAFVVGLIGYDFYAFYVGGTEATVSWTVFEWSHQYPAMTFGVGFVCGHLFWQMKPQLKLQSGGK